MDLDQGIISWVKQFEHTIFSFYSEHFFQWVGKEAKEENACWLSLHEFEKS